MGDPSHHTNHSSQSAPVDVCSERALQFAAANQQRIKVQTALLLQQGERLNQVLEAFYRMQAAHKKQVSSRRVQSQFLTQQFPHFRRCGIEDFLVHPVWQVVGTVGGGTQCRQPRGKCTADPGRAFGRLKCARDLPAPQRKLTRHVDVRAERGQQDWAANRFGQAHRRNPIRIYPVCIDRIDPTPAM